MRKKVGRTKTIFWSHAIEKLLSNIWISNRIFEFVDFTLDQGLERQDSMFKAGLTF